MCSLHLDYSFSSCFLHWHREDAPEALPSQTPPASKILKGEEQSKAQATPAPAARQRERGGGAEIGRRREGTEPANVSDQCRDADDERHLRQEGRMLEKSGRKRLQFQLKSTTQRPNFSDFRLNTHAQRSPNELMWLPVLKPTGYMCFPEDRTHASH